MNGKTPALQDRELVEMLSDEPELLAIADALVATRPAQHTERRLRGRRLWISASGVAAAAAATVVVLLVAPWGGGGGLVDRALAAVGQGPVLHVVTEQPSPLSWYRPVSLTSGKPLPVTMRQEIWFDQGRDLKKTITTLNDTVFDEVLETPQGGFTPGGPVFTCAWIAAHPVEATKARVSCNADMQNGTTPHQIREQPPTLDLALAGFVDQYRSALASGEAVKTGTGQVDGHQVIWLRIDTSKRSASPYPAIEDVAIDAATYAPLLVRTTGSRPVEFKVDEIDTVAYDPALFNRPAPAAWPSIGEVAGKVEIDPSQSLQLLNGHALWLGDSWNGYRLVRTERQELTTGYGPLSTREPTRSVGVVFTYAAPGGTADGPDALQVKEATQCEMAWGMQCGPITPSDGVLLVGQPFWSSFTLHDGLYIAISQGGTAADPVAVANALQPLTTK